MGILIQLRNRLRSILRSFGIELVRPRENTSQTWLGLKNRRFDVVIDIGANEGQFARLALDQFPNAEIHCFEPLPSAFATLCKWRDTLSSNRIHCYQLALGDVEGELEFLIHEDHSTSSSFLETTELTQDFCPSVARTAKQKVQVKTLDSVLSKELLLGKNVLLKCDVQGFEDRVLRGACETLQGVSAAMIEVNFAQLYKGQARFRDIVDLLDNASLTFAGNIGQIYDKDLSVLWADCVFLRQHSGDARRSV